MVRIPTKTGDTPILSRGLLIRGPHVWFAAGEFGRAGRHEISGQHEGHGWADGSGHRGARERDRGMSFWVGLLKA